MGTITEPTRSQGIIGKEADRAPIPKGIAVPQSRGKIMPIFLRPHRAHPPSWQALLSPHTRPIHAGNPELTLTFFAESMITINKLTLNCCLAALIVTAQAQTPENPAPAPVPAAAPAATLEATLAAGKAVYNTTCIACHQATGLGLPPVFPPLKGSDWVSAPKPGRIVRIVLHGASGPIKVNGAAFNGAMPGHAAQLTDEKIAAVITYIRQEYGNKASAVSTEYVAAARAAFKDRAAPWTEAELLAVPDK